MGTYDRLPRYRVRPRWHCVRRTSHSRPGVALGGVVVSAIAYAAHIAYERFRLQNSPGSAALHVALAVALGAFGLALGANIHSLSAGSTQHRQLLHLSLGIWPVITALPAFLVAFGTNMILARVLGSVEGSS